MRWFLVAALAAGCVGDDGIASDTDVVFEPLCAALNAWVNEPENADWLADEVGGSRYRVLRSSTCIDPLSADGVGTVTLVGHFEIIEEDRPIGSYLDFEFACDAKLYDQGWRIERCERVP